ncbi:MAG TPA: phage tail tape measure protein, partial [Acidimicrobiia bacterium]
MANGIRINVGASFDAKDIRRARREIDALDDELDGLSKGFSKVSRATQNFGQGALAIGSVMTQSVTLPIIGATTAVTKMAADFSQSMSRITGLVGISAEEVRGMESAVLDLAGETAKAPQELADALFVVTSAGLRGADAMEALTLAAKAGAAGLGVTNDIARAVAGAMNGYGAETLDAARATDVLVATARAGNFETSQFAGALGRVLPFASQAGVSIEDLGGAVALLTRTNGNATQSINLLRALFGKFVIPTEQTRSVLADVGVEMADIRDTIRSDGLVAALRELDRAVGGNREELGKLLSSEEAAAAAFEILNADAQTLTSTFGVTANAAGLTSDAFDVAAGESAFKFRRALVELQVAGTELGATFLPVVTDMIEFFTDLVSQFRDLAPAQQEFLIRTALVVAAMGPFAIAVGSAAFAVSGLTVAVGKLGVAMALATGGVSVLIGGLGLLWFRNEFAARGMDETTESAEDQKGEFDELIIRQYGAAEGYRQMDLEARAAAEGLSVAEIAARDARREMALASLTGMGSDP